MNTNCGWDTAEARMRMCGQQISYNGGETFPTEFSIAVPPIAGSVIVKFDSYAIPDRLVVLVGNTVALDTGYVGDTSYQVDLNSALAAKGLPPSTITQGTGQQTYYVTNTGEPFLTVRVYAPLLNTLWNLFLECTLE